MKEEKRICLNRSVLDFMASQLTKRSGVLEFGGGWSSKWFAKRCARLIVIETSFKWAGVIKGELKGKGLVVVPRVGLHFVPDVNRMLGGVNNVDLVLVDCTEPLRYRATQIAWPRLKPGGWLVFDDAQRDRHHACVKWLCEKAGNPVRLIWQPGDVETAVGRLALAWQKESG